MGRNEFAIPWLFFSFCFFHVYIIIHRIVTLVPTKDKKYIYMYIVHTRWIMTAWIVVVSPDIISKCFFFWYIYIDIYVDENLYRKLFMHSPVRRSILGIVIGVLYTCTFCRYVFLEWKHTKNHENPFSCRLCRLYRFFEKRK